MDSDDPAIVTEIDGQPGYLVPVRKIWAAVSAADTGRGSWDVVVRVSGSYGDHQIALAMAEHLAGHLGLPLEVRDVGGS